MIREHAWGICVGESAFSAIYPRYAISGIESVAHSHQIFLQILTELGIPGITVFLFFLLLLLLYTAGGLQRLHGRPRAELLGCAGALLGALVMGLFDHLWYQHGMLCMFIALSALLCARDWEVA